MPPATYNATGRQGTERNPVAVSSANMTRQCALQYSRLAWQVSIGKQKSRWLKFPGHLLSICSADDYIMPPIPPAGIAGAASFSGMSTIAHSVVRNIPATEAAFSRATRATLVGSITPASNILTYSSVRAL